MRYLHPIASHELFVAQGKYHYFCNDERLPIDEQWTIHELKGGASLIRVDENARDQDGLMIMSEALYNDLWQLERFNVVSDNIHRPKLEHFKADYTFMPDYVQMGQRKAHGAHNYEERKLMGEMLIYIRQTIFMGFLIHDIVHKGGRSNVFAPQMMFDGESEVLRIQVEKVQEEIIHSGNKAILTVCYQIADDVFYWLDSNKIVIQRQYKHNNDTYRVLIGDYAYR